MAAVVAVWAGMVLGARGGAWIAPAIVLALAFAGLAWRAPPRVGAMAAIIALLFAGAARSAAHHLRIDAERARFEASGGPESQGDVAAEPSDRALHRLRARVVEPPLDASGEPRATVVIEAAEPALLAGTRVRLRFPAGTIVSWSDRVTALARLGLPDRPRNPGGYDGRGAATARAVALEGKAYWAEPVGARGLAAWPRVTAERWRRAIEHAIDTHLDSTARALVLPLVIGDRSGLEPAWRARLRAAGLVHLLALSGLHVAWLAGVARVIVGALGGGVRARAVAGTVCALFYLGISGPLPSLARAAVTELVGSAARLGSRALDGVQALAVSALLLLAVAPGWAFDLGFQLSCAATLGLATIGAPVRGDVAVRVARVGAALERAFAPALGAQLAAMPLLLARLHAVSWITPLSNLLAVPLVGLLLAAAWIGLALEAAVPGAGGPFWSACDVLARAFSAVAGGAARAPGVLLGPGNEPGIAWLAGAGVVIWVVGCGRARTAAAVGAPGDPIGRTARVGGACACALAVLMAATTHPLRPPPGRTWAVVLDVGQGDAMAIAGESGWWLIDAGPRSPRHDAGERVVLPFLRWAGVRELEGLMLTHADLDHVGGAHAVTRGVAAHRMDVPIGFGAADAGARADDESAEEAALRAIGVTGRVTTLVRGARPSRAPPIVVAWPPPVWPAELAASDNATGLVVELGQGRARLLALADVDSVIEARLDVAPGVAVMKLGHHGSGSSTGRATLARLCPRLAVISCGRGNPFGHPHPDVLARLAAAAVPCRRTDLEGALWFELTDEEVRVVDWRKALPIARDARPRAPATPSRPAD